MPVPGQPRNPYGQTPTRFRPRRRYFIARLGETPGHMDIDTRADTVAPGTIRRNWRQSVNAVPAPPPFSWVYNNGLGGITRALRYKASTVFRAAGTDNTRFGAPRAIVPSRINARPVTIAAGNQQGRPAVRNRMTSFGRRVTPVNQPSRAAAKR